MNNLTVFTGLNLIGRVGTMPLIEMESTMQITSLCDLNKPTSNEFNSNMFFLA